MLNRPFTKIADAPDLLTVAEVRRILPAGRNLLYEMLKDGRLPSVRLGRRLMVPRAGLARFIGAE